MRTFTKAQVTTRKHNRQQAANRAYGKMKVVEGTGDHELDSVSSNQQEQKSEKVAYENPLMSNDMLRRIHAYMVQCRAEGNGAAGLEAVEVATLVHLRPGDTIATVGRHWNSRRVASGALARMMGELFPERGEQGVPKVIAEAPTPSAQLGIATGVAFAYKMQGLSNVAVVFGGRAILASGSTALVEFAGERNLPVLYVIETNLAQESTPGRIQKLDDEVNALAAQSGFPAIPVEGNDAVAVYRVAQEAIARARKGGGPTLIDCKTLRGASAKRKQASVDPILHMEQYLNKRGLKVRTSF